MSDPLANGAPLTPRETNLLVELTMCFGTTGLSNRERQRVLTAFLATAAILIMPDHVDAELHAAGAEAIGRDAALSIRKVAAGYRAGVRSS